MKLYFKRDIKKDFRHIAEIFFCLSMIAEQMLTDTHLALKLRNLFHYFLRRVQGLFLPEVIQLAHDSVLLLR